MLEMKNKILVLIFCFFILSVPGVYGNNTSGITPQVFDELKLQINYYNLYTANSWFQPVVIRKKPGNYAFTVAGPVYFTKSSKKWPGAYWDSSAITDPVPLVYCQVYRSPYIKGGHIGLLWVGIGANGEPNTEIRIQQVQFGETDKNTTSYPFNQEKYNNFTLKFNKNVSLLIMPLNKNGRINNGLFN